MDFRSTSLDFLDRCSAMVKRMYEYWDGKRNGRRMPARADIDPTEFSRALPGILLVDVSWEPLDFRYRVVGTREVAARGYDPTGKRIAENWFGAGSQEHVMRNYQYVATEGAILYDRSAFQSSREVSLLDESLFLPLSNGGDRCDQILVYSQYRDLEKPRRD